MRVLHVMRAPTGGLFRHVRDLAQATIDAGLAHGLICDPRFAPPGSLEESPATPDPFGLGVAPVRVSRLPSIRDLSAISAVAAVVDRIQPDILHGHGAKGGLFARIVGKLKGVPTVYTTHGGSIHYSWRSISGISYLTLERAMLAWTGGVIFESEYIRDEFEKKVGSPRESKVIPHGVHSFVPVATPKKCDFVFLGELRKLKGLVELFSALRLLGRDGIVPTVRIYGSGPDEEWLRNCARRLGIDQNVRWMGYTNDPARALASGRAVVIPSLKESYCYTAVESLAAGSPIIASRTGVLKGLSKDFDPILFPAGGVDELAHAMRNFIERPDQALMLSAQLWSSKSTEWNVESMATDTLEFYERMLNPAT